MAAGTVVSRLTGFLRDIVIAWAIGTAVFADTYNVANTVPNIIYILLVGGALNAVFIPQLVRAMRDDADGGEAFANRLLTASGVVLLAITLAAVLAAPLIVGLYALAFTGDGAAAEFEIATTFARYFLPQIFFYGVHVMVGQVLNARGRFGPMMWTPILNNVVVIATGLILILVTGGARPTPGSVSSGEVRLLAIGTTLGVVVQALALLPYLRSAGLRFRPRFDWKGAGLGKSYRLARWTILFVLVNQVSYLVVVQVATAVGKAATEAGLATGVGFTPYTKAYLIMQLPHAIVTVSVVTALLPRMSRAAHAGRLDEVRHDISHGLRLTGVAVVPAAFAFLVLGPSLATVMYARGATSVADAEFIGYVLSAFALGLVPFSAHHQLLRGFYALEDTRTPVTINVWIAATHVALALLSWWLLPLRWVVVGVAVGFSLSYVVGVTLSALRLRGRLGAVDGQHVLRTYNRLILVSVAAAGPAVLVSFVTSRLLGPGTLGSAVTVLVGGMLMVGTFLVLARRLRVTELTELLGALRGRVRGSRG